ncbi:MAG: hypothetical protein QOC76_466 [Mycobacterium sp.]|nr:hypothetical protein [Mycobacterium sp.]
MSAADGGSARRRTASGMSFVKRGVGKPVLLLHGWCLDGSLWAYEEDELFSDHQVFVPDLPGFGRSDTMPEPYDMNAHTDAVIELLVEQGLRDVLVIGFAFGAAVALTVAARDDSRVSGVIAVGVPSCKVFPAERMARAMRRDWPEFARRSAAVLCKQPQSDATLSWLERVFGATPLRSALQGVALLGEFDPLPLCESVSKPVLFVHGQDDDVIPIREAQACAESAPRGSLRVLPECGHLVVLDQRHVLHDTIVGFEDTLTRSDRP